MTKEQLIAELTARLKNSGFESARFEATQIVNAVCGSYMLSQKVAPELVALAESKAELRLKHEPLQYILGEWEFYGLPFKVGPGVLIPRQDTETLVETALPLLKPSRNRVFDLCAGSGCIGIALAKLSGAKVTFFEKSDDALPYLEENIRLNGIEAEVLHYDVLGAPPKMKVDMIVSNPPYIKTAVVEGLETEVKCEPLMALDGGEDGLRFYRHIATAWKPCIELGGYLIFEIGFDQGEEVTEIMKNAGYRDVQCKKDLCGEDRVVIGRK
ncbi:MAG: peptide chain release factor N(5)-glutamine methyltransferase [Clostridia bacterium]|nr:peptide chain release factor N(5)-glutamine methyltransferase [Clostridia bacterium]